VLVHTRRRSQRPTPNESSSDTRALGITLIVYTTVATVALFAVGADDLAVSAAPLTTVVRGQLADVGSADRQDRSCDRFARRAALVVGRSRLDNVRDGERARPAALVLSGPSTAQGPAPSRDDDRRDRHRCAALRRYPRCDRIQFVCRSRLLRDRERRGVDASAGATALAPLHVSGRRRRLCRRRSLAPRGESSEDSSSWPSGSRHGPFHRRTTSPYSTRP